MVIRQIMKRTFLYIILAAVICLMTGCEKKNPTGTPGNDGGTTVIPPDENESNPPVTETLLDIICGEWHYLSADNKTDIYLNLMPDGRFELYQKFEAGIHHLYRGSWTLEDSTLSGIYNDGEAWNNSYIVTVSDDKNALNLKYTGDESADFLYSRTTIPESVKETCIIEVKSLLMF